MTLVKFRLAASALVPAALILAARMWSPDAWYWSAFFLAAAVLATISLVAFVRARETTNPQPRTLTSVDDESDNVPALLLTYLFPFLFLTVADWRDAVAYAVLAVILLLLIVRTDIWKVNPLLLMAGYRIYAVTFQPGEASLLFSRSRPRSGDVVRVVGLSDGVTKQLLPKSAV